MPSGAPAEILTITPYILDLESGTSTPLGPDGARSWRPWWSPDGTQLAYYCDAGGYPQVWVHDVGTGRDRKVSEQRVNVKSMLGDEPYWSVDGTEVLVPLYPGVADDADSEPTPDPDADAADGASTATAMASASGPTVAVFRAGSEADPDAGAERDRRVSDDPERRSHLREACGIGAVNVADGSVRTIVDRHTMPYPSVLQRSPSGKWLSYVSVSTPRTEKVVNGVVVPTFEMTSDIAVVPVEGGRITVLAESVRMFNWRHYYLDAYIWHPSKDRLLWIHDGALWTGECGRSAGQPLRLGDDVGPFTTMPLTVTADGRAVIGGVGSGNQRDLGGFVRPASLAVIPLPTRGKGAGTPPADKTLLIPLPPGIELVDVVEQAPNRAWSPGPKPSITIVGHRTATGDRVLMRADLASGDVRILWEAAAMVRFVGCAGDTSTIIGSYEDFDTPSDLYRFDASGKRVGRLTTVEPRLDGVRFGSLERFSTKVPQPDGSLIEATSLLLLPHGAKAGDQLPCVTIAYPGKGAKANGAYGGGFESTMPVPAFLSRGYAVLIADAPIGPRGPDGGNPLQDVVDVVVPQVYRAANLGYIDLARVAIAGQSYGGYGAVAAITGTTLFRAAIAVNGRYDLLGNYEDFWSERGQGRMGTHPWADQQRYLLNSPYARADRIRTPLLLLHGDLDDIRISDGYKMFKALKRLGQPVQLAVYKGCGHVPSEWGLANQIDATERMVDFLDRHLGSAAAGSATTDA